MEAGVLWLRKKFYHSFYLSDMETHLLKDSKNYILMFKLFIKLPVYLIEYLTSSIQSRSISINIIFEIFLQFKRLTCPRLQFKWQKRLFYTNNRLFGISNLPETHSRACSLSFHLSPNSFGTSSCVQPDQNSVEVSLCCNFRAC